MKTRPLAPPRLLVLVAVNALIVLHVVAYYVLGKRGLGCIDFFGLGTFLGLGRVTAGTIFIGILIAITLIFGRVFCGWGCHFALFQDLLTRLLQKVGVRPPFRRSRLEFVVPPLMIVVTLLYPIMAWWRRNGMPQAYRLDLTYPDLWHLLPGLKGTILILVVDVVLLTLLFGGRAFCRYICPYGLFLKIFHVIAPTRVVKSRSCADCRGDCTRVCPTGVPIKLEIDRFSVIRDLNCMNCGDCVSACPTGVLKMRPTKRAYATLSARRRPMTGQPRWVELVLLLCVILGLFAYRGPEFGDFLSAGLGLVVAALVVVSVQPRRFFLRTLTNDWRVSAIRACSGAIGLYMLVGLAGQCLGAAAIVVGGHAFADNDYVTTMRAYSFGRRIATPLTPFTFYLDDFDKRTRRHIDVFSNQAEKLMKRGSWHEAELLYRAIVAAQPQRIDASGDLGEALLKQGKYWEAATCYLTVLNYDPNDLVALYQLAITRIQLGQFDDAVSIVQKILSADTVGTAYKLIRDNPLFMLLEHDVRYRRAMELYRVRLVPKS